MIKLVSNTSIPPEGIELASPEDLYSFCEDHDTLAIDTETEGDFDFNNQIITYQVGNADTQFVVDASYLNPKSIKQYLEDPSKLKLFQNALFDLKFFKFYGIDVSNIGDTFLNELILNCGLLNSGYGLDVLSHKYTDYKMTKDVRGEIGKEGLTKRVIEYAAKDVQVLPEIYSKQHSFLEEHGLVTIQRLEHKALHGFCDMEYHGMGVDADQLRQVAKEDLEKLEELKNELDQIVTKDKKLSKVFRKQFVQTDLFDTPRTVDINYNSPLQIQKALKALGIKVESTGKEFLKKIEDKHQFIKKLLEYRNIQKRCSTYGYNLLDCINPHTKRIHTRFWQVLNTGRVSSGQKKKKGQEIDYPNMQNIPADNRYRNIFTVSKGHKLVMCDYGSQELALIAADSKDEVWERIIQNGEDLHSVVAEKVFEKDWEDATEDGCQFAANKEKCGCKGHKEMRTTIKTINYACLPKDSTQILTTEGWKYYEELKENDYVLSYNEEKDLTEFVPIENSVEFSDEEVYKLKNGWWESESTSDHRWLIRQYTGRGRTKRYVSEYRSTSRITNASNIVVTKPFEGGSSNISKKDGELLGWILSEGYLKWEAHSNGPSTSFGTKRGVTCIIAQSTYKQDVIDCLNEVGFDFKEYKNNNKVPIFSLDPQHFREFCRRIGIPEESKHSIDWTKIIASMTHESIKGFFNAFYKGDGDNPSGGSSNGTLRITQNEGNTLEAVELAAFLLGYRTNVTQKSHNASSGKDCKTLTCSVYSTISGQKMKKYYSRKTDVFCLTTKNSNFVIRQGKNITITGNCSYQAGPGRIADTLNISTKRASEIIEMYFSTFPKLKEYFEKTKRFGKRHLYIKTFAPFGRKRFFTEPTTYKELSSIEKESANTRIQGTGADIIKLAIVYIKDYIDKNNYPAKLLLQVHDELITEVEEGYEEEWAEIKAGLMRKASDKVCPLPIEVDTNIADKWEK